MSRTYRKIRNKKWAKDFHDGKLQKLGLRRSCMHHLNTGKMALGPGGISCPCCIPVNRDEVKVKIRRWERHTAKLPDFEDFSETPIDKTE